MQRARAKNVAPPNLAVRVLRSGDTEVVLLSFTPKQRGGLTAAERDVALAVARGLSNAQIANERQASPRTIANQVASIMRKLGVSSRAELVARFGARDFI